MFLQIHEDEFLRVRHIGRRRFQVGRVKNFLHFASVIRVSDEVGETIQDRRDKLAGFSRPTSKLVTGFARIDVAAGTRPTDFARVVVPRDVPVAADAEGVTPPMKES